VCGFKTSIWPGAPPGVIAALVLLEVLVRDAPVLADQAEGDFSALQKLDQIGT
jgi:hypothetical protein